MKLEANLDPYEAFMKFGYGDGDDSGAVWAIDKVREAIHKAGLGTDVTGGTHNPYICTIIEDGQKFKLPTELAYCDTSYEVRTMLLYLGWDSVVRAIDALI